MTIGRSARSSAGSANQISCFTLDTVNFFPKYAAEAIIIATLLNVLQIEYDRDVTNDIVYHSIPSPSPTLYEAIELMY